MENNNSYSESLTYLQALYIFFSPKTIEEQYIFSKISIELTEQARKVIPQFTEEEAHKLFSCTNPEDCFRCVNDILWRIYSEEKVLPFSTREMQDILKRFHGIFKK